MKVRATIFLIEESTVSVELDADDEQHVHPGNVLAAVREQHAELVGDRQVQLNHYSTEPE